MSCSYTASFCSHVAVIACACETRAFGNPRDMADERRKSCMNHTTFSMNEDLQTIFTSKEHVIREHATHSKNLRVDVIRFKFLTTCKGELYVYRLF